MTHLVYGQINFTLPQGRLTDSVIALIVDNYKELLEYDICNYDDRSGYVSGVLIIRPHLQDIEIPVSQKLYSLLDRISITYLQGRVDMTGFLSIQL